MEVETILRQIRGDHIFAGTQGGPACLQRFGELALELQRSVQLIKFALYGGSQLLISADRTGHLFTRHAKAKLEYKSAAAARDTLDVALPPEGCPFARGQTKPG